MKKKLLVICGPTATGKTKLAVSIAKQFDGEIISADSRQLYKGMDIGTGKDLPTKETIDRLRLAAQFKGKNYTLVPYNFDTIPIWMYDVVNPDEEFSVAHYHALATQVIADIHKSHKPPIAVGGTGLYIRAITRGIETASIPPDLALRKALLQLPLIKLQQKLVDNFPDNWKNLNDSDKKNPRRLIRKFELGSSPLKQKSSSPSYDVLWIGLTLPPDVLKKRIDVRVDTRIAKGQEKEIETLLARGYGWNLPSMSALGYKEWRTYWEYNRQPGRLEALRVQWKRAEYQYAKRQLTWFKKEPSVEWYDVSSPAIGPQIERRVASWYTMTA